MPFADLVADNLPEELQQSVREVLDLKTKIREKDKQKRYSELDAFITAELPGLKVYADDLESGEPRDVTSLNKIFYSTVIEDL